MESWYDFFSRLLKIFSKFSVIIQETSHQQLPIKRKLIKVIFGINDRIQHYHGQEAAGVLWVV